MKKRYIKIISSCMLALCLTIAMVFTVLHTDASNSNQIQYFERTYVEDNTIPETPEGYLFAGWYTQSGETYLAQSNPTIGKTYFAKFVPEEVLGIKAQISNNIIAGEIDNKENNAIRLVTSLDSTDYKHIGFNIKKGSGEAKDAETTKKVYKTLYAVGATETTEETKLTYKANEEFHSASNYFKTWTIGKIPEGAFNSDITVTPYWITLDGTRVEGRTSIKTVNLGRSWVYINSSANVDGVGEFGTYEHPFTQLDSALNAILIEKNGEITIQKDSVVSVSSGFVWEKAKNTRNITISGESKETSALNFSAMSNLEINDNLNFDNMTLTLSKTVYANGHDFIIQENVVSENPTTSIYGGKKGTSSKGATVSKTNIEIYAGSYKEVWGGGNYCTISNDINVVIKNANIFDDSASDKSRVFGSGANDTVKGNIYVTIGGTFNQKYDVAEFERNNVLTTHKRYSSVHGAGSGTVEGNTYVRIEDQAEVDYVYGGGGANSEVKGTCYVEIKGGTVFSIYGGGKGDNSSTAGKNADTSVVVTGGKVCQIIGGNGNSMTGNSYVEIAGGQVTRRIYGGCYNDVSETNAHHVTGYSTVVIKDETAVSNLSGLDSGIIAGSRSEIEYSDEIAVLICNNDSYASLKDDLLTSYNEYDYLVQANAGGVVSSIGTRLSVTPNDENNAVVRLDDNANGILHAYMTSKGMSILPELNADTGKREVYVVFGTEQLDAGTLSGYEAKVGGTHFDTLENAIAEANALSTTSEVAVVTLLKDVSIDSELVIDAKSNIIVQSENKYTITGTDSTKNLFKVNGIFAINRIKLIGGYDGINVYRNTLSVTDVEISNSGRNAVFGNGGNIVLSNVKVTGTKKQALLFQNKAIAYVSEFNVVGTSQQVAVRILGGADVVLNNGTILANSGYGIYINEPYSKVKATDTKITRETGTNALVGVDNATAQLIFNQSETGEAYIDGNSLDGRGVEVKGTFVLNGGTITNNSAETGAGVMVNSGATFTMTGGEISNNTATSASSGGGGVYVATDGTFYMNESETEGTTGGVIKENIANKYGAGVFIEGTFIMNAGTITKHGSSAARSTAEGTAVCLSGDVASFTMNRGKISNNYSSASAAGVALRDGTTGPTFTMNGGEISGNNTSKSATGVIVRTGEFIMTSGTISNNINSGNSNGAGVYVTSKFTMTGGSISENSATKNGGGVYVNADGKFIMSGGTFSNNTATSGGRDVYLMGNSSKIELSEAFEGNISVMPASYSEGRVIAAKGGISDEEFKQSMKCLAIEDKDGHWFVNDEGILTKGPVVLQSTGMGYATLSDAMEAATEGDTITILRNEEISNTITVAKNLKFTSDKEVTITASATMASDMIYVDAGKEFEITGVSETAKIRFVANTKVQNVIHSLGITRLTNVKTTGGAIGVYVPSGSVIANNIEIQNTSDKGLSVQAGASVTISGIVVKNTGGQGLYFTGKSGQITTVNISNFEISGTKAAAVRPMSYCNVTLSNGTVTVPNIEGLAMGKNNTYQITDMKVYTNQERITNKKVLWYNGAHVANEYYTGVTVLPIE